MKNTFAVPVLRVRPLSALAALFALAALINAVIVGCGGQTQESTQSQSQAQSQSPPVASTTPDEHGAVGGGEVSGAKIYAEKCAMCHGTEGRGDGPASAGLNPKPRNHTDGSYMNTQTDAALLEVIKNGKGAMPPWGSVLSEEEVRAVLQHIRSLAQPAYQGS